MEFKEMQKEHLRRMHLALKKSSDELLKRAREHDLDKENNPIIKEAYDEHFGELKKIEFGTNAYRDYEIKYFDKAHQLHAQNRHHYYSYRNNMDDVNLFDVIEAILDISESSKQYGTGEYESSFREKGLYDYDLEELIVNTVKFLEEK